MYMCVCIGICTCMYTFTSTCYTYGTETLRLEWIAESVYIYTHT